jgi:hypothetical protein
MPTSSPWLPAVAMIVLGIGASSMSRSIALNNYTTRSWSASNWRGQTEFSELNAAYS